MFITQLIKNEIESALERDVMRHEFDRFSGYIHDAVVDKINDGKKVCLSDITSAILLCRHENFKCCEECGEWNLYEEMNDMGHNYCLTCRPYYDPDVSWNDQKIKE